MPHSFVPPPKGSFFAVRESASPLPNGSGIREALAC
jgi:hypothetical protein